MASMVDFHYYEKIYSCSRTSRTFALLDTALRRRFGFIELMPDLTILKDVVVGSIPVAQWLKQLNERICRYLGADARNLQIGHTYFMNGSEPIKDFAEFARIIREDIVPLLEEYCYEDYSLLEKLLGSSLISGDNLSIRDELFDKGRESELIAALLKPCPDLSASIQAVEAEPEPNYEEDSSEDEDNEESES